MSLPPALTWLQLFPRGTACETESSPAWFQEMLSARGNGESPCENGASSAVLAAWDCPWNDLSRQVAGREGFVAINCPGATTRRAEEAGFAYARAFAVVPTLANPRWFIPLDNPRVSSAAFSLYTPARASAHLKRSAVRLAARLKMRFWYRDQIVVASRRRPPLEEHLAGLFPGQALRLGISAGAPEPAKNRKASAAVLDSRGRVLAFVKISESDVARRLQTHAAGVLEALAHRSIGGVIAPRRLFAGEVDGRFVTVQTPLEGKPAPARLTIAHRRFLEAMQSGSMKPASETAMVRGMRGRLEALRPEHDDLSAALERFLPVLEGMLLPSTVVHGDFAPWNLRLRRGRISAFDWEYAELDGLPLIDELHFTLQLGYLLRKWDAGRASDELAKMTSRRPLGLTAEQVRAIQAVYVLDQLARLLAEGYPADDEMVGWYAQLLPRLDAPARCGVLV